LPTVRQGIVDIDRRIRSDDRGHQGGDVSQSKYCLRVDQALCVGHNRCIAVAPMLFELDDMGNSHEIGDGRVPVELLELARDAVLSCPETAVTLVEVDPTDASGC
jgi:ferredoxin